MNSSQKIAIILLVIAIVAASVNAYITVNKVCPDPCKTCIDYGNICTRSINFGDIATFEEPLEETSEGIRGSS